MKTIKEVEYEEKIKELQEENYKLKQQLNCKEEFTKYLPEDIEWILLTKSDYDRQQIELQDIINKAIEYIEKYVSYYDMEGDLRNRLLNILKGDNK